MVFVVGKGGITRDVEGSGVVPGGVEIPVGDDERGVEDEEISVVFDVGKGGVTREELDSAGLELDDVQRVVDCIRLDAEERTVVEFSVGNGGTIGLEEETGVAREDDALVEFHDGLEIDDRTVLEGNPGGTAVTVRFRDTDTLLGPGKEMDGNEDGNGIGVKDLVIFHGPVGVGSVTVTRLSEDRTLVLDRFEEAVVKIGGRIVEGEGTTTEERRDVLSDGRGGNVVGGSDGNETPPLIVESPRERDTLTVGSVTIGPDIEGCTPVVRGIDGNETPPLMVENPMERDTFTVGSVMIGSDIEGCTPVVRGIDGCTEDSEGNPLVNTGVDARTEEVVAFNVGKGGSESDGSPTVDDNRGGVNVLDKLMLLPMGMLLEGTTTPVPVPVGIERVDDSKEVVPGVTVGSEGSTDRPIEFDSDGVLRDTLTLEGIPVPGREGKTTEDVCTGGLNENETPRDSDGRGIPEGSTQVPFWAHAAPMRPATTKEEPIILAIDS